MGTENNRLLAQERYMRDPMFKTLVDQLFHQLSLSNYTPTELREAVMLAAVRYESMTIRPMFYGPNDETMILERKY
jgi:hypothetical protein